MPRCFGLHFARLACLSRISRLFSLTVHTATFYSNLMIELVFSRDGRPCLRQQVGKSPLTIGRDLNNHIQLTDEDISRCHCKIEWVSGKYVLTDLSRNGTLLNNQPIKSSTITIGDTVTIGRWSVSVVDTPEKPSEITVMASRRPTSILSFDKDKKTISTQRISLIIIPPDEKLVPVSITQTEATIGSLDSCDVSIHDPFVSRRHCRLIHRDGRIVLMDLGSTNGTYVDNVRIEQVSLPSQGQFRIGKTLIRYRLEREASAIKPIEGASLGPMIGKSEVMREIFALIERVAPSDATVLVTGETGTGKELVARLLHQMSHRAEKPFVSVNCGAIPASIIESQLFGHERGAFTGAIERMAGLFEQAHGGTLFLDEIGEMPLELQTRLLQVLENHRIRRLGGKEDIDVDFRLIAATNKELQRLVSDQRFRQDLFYRLFVVPINLMSLRERGEDTRLLAEHFAGEFSPPNAPMRITDEAITKICSHNWPGNVRELRNVIQRSILLSSENVIDAKDITFAPIAMESLLEHNLEIKERETIVAALSQNKGNQTKTARQLGIARTTLCVKIQKYQIDLSKLE
jgi:DNA-binding NtrC family response regulator